MIKLVVISPAFSHASFSLIFGELALINNIDQESLIVCVDDF